MCLSSFGRLHGNDNTRADESLLCVETCPNSVENTEKKWKEDDLSTNQIKKWLEQKSSSWIQKSK